MSRLPRLTILALLVALMTASAAWSGSPTMVVSQVFAGGGNSSAPYSNDFVELFNRGSTAVDPSRCSIQSASASGTTSPLTPPAPPAPPRGPSPLPPPPPPPPAPPPPPPP